MSAELQTPSPSELVPARSSRATYWSYIELDTLLSLVHPFSTLPDERAFIVFHQIIELILNLTIHEAEQIVGRGRADVEVWKSKLRRIVLYYRLMTRLTGLLGEVVDRQQFLAIRTLLSPASAFQSFQFRKLELLSANLHDLIPDPMRAQFAPDTAPEILFEHLYWRTAAPAQGTAGEAATLSDFETRYLLELRRLAVAYNGHTLASRFAALAPGLREDAVLRDLLRRFDSLANLAWPEAHLRLVERFLAGEAKLAAGTGGTDWSKYLRRRASIRYFRDLEIGGSEE